MKEAEMKAIGTGKLAVITGGASWIGLAAAQRFAAQGMKICLIDWADDVTQMAASLGGEGFKIDVSERSAVDSLAADIQARHGPASVLMNNAGVGRGGDILAGADAWARVLGVNLLGVLHGAQAFLPGMIAGGGPGLVINTGSKQGITQPPGDTAYNVSKSGVKALTEGLAHTLRTQTGGRISAHLLIPGFTYTGLTRSQGEKPPAAWTSEQVIDFMMDSLANGDFYILCPDNDVTRAMDEKRIAWMAGDIIENRPALSRWHPDWEERFAAFMATD
jgi:NAD(P)-dependent dehydrogenase (short-subunit alcohol dehydrogenase family)